MDMTSDIIELELVKSLVDKNGEQVLVGGSV